MRNVIFAYGLERLTDGSDWIADMYADSSGEKIEISSG
jgi:hypothetical protein